MAEIHPFYETYRGGCGNGAMVEPLRHRQTKGAATDMFYLTPPRHISTLPNCDKQACRWRVRSSLNIRHSLTSISKLLPFAAPCAPAPFVRAAIGETQQAAWVAICELANALKEEGFAGPTLWKAALSATESWMELLI